MPGSSKTFDVLDPDLPLYRNHFIEASAGTGKTFAIEQLVKRMLEDPEGPELDEILVVTFTRAATFELKNRIGQSEAKVFTIHGFCFQILQEFALETGFSLDQVEESASSTELFKIVKDYLRTEIDLSPKQLEKILRKHQNQIDLLVARLVSIASNRLPVEYTIPDVLSEVRNFKVNPELLLEDLLNLAPQYGKLCDRQKRVKDVEGFKIFVHLFAGEKVDYIDLPILKMIPENRLKRASEVTLNYPGLLEKMQEKLIPMIAEASDELNILAQLAEGARCAIERVVENEDLFFFEDLLRMMSKHLENPEFAQKIRNQYRAVFIDEFQDTDPVQWKIFSTLFLADQFKGPIYLVGDPKQAIYQFRGGDVYTYLSAKKMLGEEYEATLDRNFRSDPHLVEALNDLFNRSDFLKLSKAGETLPCPPVEAASSEKTPWDDERGRVHIVHGDEEKALFTFIIEEIQRLKIPLRECAILVKDRFQAERFVKFSPLPTVTKRSRSLVDSSAFAALTDLLGAILNPRGRNQVTPLLWNLSPEQIAHAYHLLHNEGLLSCFEKLSAEILPSGELFQDMLQLIELIAQEGIPVDGILPYLQRLKQENPDSERLKARAANEADAIQVMTIHVSKGLEFSVVFPIGLALSHPSKRDFVRENGRMIVKDPDDSEKMRLLYVACTRAKYRLYLPVLDNEEAPINLFLSQLGEFSHPHITSSKCEFKNVQVIPQPPQKLYPPEEIILRFPLQEVRSFSSLAKHVESQISPPQNILPVGPESGSLLHKVFEELPFEKAFKAREASDVFPYIEKSLKHTFLEPWLQEISEIVFKTLFTPLNGEFPLAAVDPKKITKEMEFLYPTEQGYLKGFIDLFFEHRNQFYFLDWKSNYLEDYSRASLEEAMKRHQYDLQSKIYREALERYLKLFDDNYKINGVFYVFLRGPAVYA